VIRSRAAVVEQHAKANRFSGFSRSRPHTPLPRSLRT
jgi:hypothetical protein